MPFSPMSVPPRCTVQVIPQGPANGGGGGHKQNEGHALVKLQKLRYHHCPPPPPCT